MKKAKGAALKTAVSGGKAKAAKEDYKKELKDKLAFDEAIKLNDKDEADDVKK